MMDSSYYLPSEVLSFKNFPEVQQQLQNIQTLQAYGLVVDNTLTNYTKGSADKIDVNLNELETNIALCRSVCEILGNADNVCFDVLLALREIQKAMQNLRYYGVNYGNKYVGKPSTSQAGGI